MDIKTASRLKKVISKAPFEQIEAPEYTGVKGYYNVPFMTKGTMEKRVLIAKGDMELSKVKEQISVIKKLFPIQ